MHSDWLTENENKFADWSKTKFSLVSKDHTTVHTSENFGKWQV